MKLENEERSIMQFIRANNLLGQKVWQANNESFDTSDLSVNLNV